jgi:hypothetical protein
MGAIGKARVILWNVIQSRSGLISCALSCAVLTAALASQALAAGSGSDDSYWKKDPSEWQVEIRPLQLWVSHLSTKVALPDLPDRPNGTATSELDGAYSGGFRLEKNKWSIDANFLFADLTAENPNPKVQSDARIELAQFMVGRQVLPGLSLEGGVRRMSLELSAKVLEYPEVRGESVLWDPLIGMTFRKPLGKKLRLNVHGDGGGFGAGSDVTYSANATLDWRFAKHFGMSLGYNFLHFETSQTYSKLMLITEPTIHGPVVAFGIYF